VVVDAEGQRKARKTTLRSEWRSVRKKNSKRVEKKKKGLDRVSIVRDVRLHDQSGALKLYQSQNRAPVDLCTC